MIQFIIFWICLWAILTSIGLSVDEAIRESKRYRLFVYMVTCILSLYVTVLVLGGRV